MMRIVVVVFLLAVLSACSSGYHMRKGNKFYESGRYYKASNRYEKAFEKMSRSGNKAGVAMKVGEAFEEVNKLQNAYNWYRKASQADKEYPEAYIKMAEMCVYRGDLDGAEAILERFNDLFPDDERGKDGIYSLEVLKKDVGAEGRYEVQAIKEVNSRDHDFAPAYDPMDNNVLYFTSTRPLKAKKKRRKADPVTGDSYSHIFATEYTQEIRRKNNRGVVKVTHYPEPRWIAPVNASDSLLSKKNDGAVSFTSDGQTMYFTSSRLVDGKNLGTRIYVATKSGGSGGDEEGEKEGMGWSKVDKSGVCGDSVSVGHPAITPDGSRLYFVSDMIPGGYGGKDIWYVESTGGGWGEPQNAGEMVNTEGDELYPYVRDNGVLYFASNGFPDGLGGLDIYKVTENEGEQVRERLPAPINSYADDFGITFKGGKEEGMFSSSRSNRSDNIYFFKYIPQQLIMRLLAVNNLTERAIPMAEAVVVADDGEMTTHVSDSTGYIVMGLQPEKEYAVTVKHDDYLVGKADVSTYRQKEDRVYEVVVELQPIEKPIVIPNIYFDVAKWELREDAMRNLGELLKILKDNPNITIELSAHTDMVGNDRDNMVLSERRAISVVEYLITQGIYWDRMTAKGYGKNRPREIAEKDARDYDFLKEGDVLDREFIWKLKPEQRETALQLNRRIEFVVLRTDYKPGPNSENRPETIKELLGKEPGEVAKKEEGVVLKDIGSIKGEFFTLQLGVFKNRPDALLKNFKVVFTEKLENGTVRYCVGAYETREEAERAGADWKKKGIEVFVKEYRN